jgi:hypothetical protein
VKDLLGEVEGAEFKADLRAMALPDYSLAWKLLLFQLADQKVVH